MTPGHAKYQAAGIDLESEKNRPDPIPGTIYIFFDVTKRKTGWKSSLCWTGTGAMIDFDVEVIVHRFVSRFREKDKNSRL